VRKIQRLESELAAAKQENASLVAQLESSQQNAIAVEDKLQQSAEREKSNLSTISELHETILPLQQQLAICTERAEEQAAKLVVCALFTGSCLWPRTATVLLQCCSRKCQL